MVNRDEVLAIYERGPEAVVALVEALIERQEARIAELGARVEELEDRLAKDSRNSSKPPSSDSGGEKPAPKSLRGKSGRKPGGQPGHPGKTLPLAEEPDRVVVHSPGGCAPCGGALREGEAVGYERRQVVELPPLYLEVTEHRAERKRCRGCGSTTTAAFPPEVSGKVQYGARARALGVYLNQYQLLPFDRAGELVADVFGGSLGEGTLYSSVERCYEALEGTQEGIAREVGGAEVAHFDETGLDVAGRGRWLHVASTPGLTHYAVHDKRGASATRDIGVLPRFGGIAVHDGSYGYREYGCAHALCNAHHLRELTFIEERHGQGWAGEMRAHLLDIKGAVEEARDGGGTRLDAERIGGYEARYQESIAAGIGANPPPIRTGEPGRPRQTKGKNLVDRLDKGRDDVLRFMRDFRVPFDNNQAERDIRMVKVQQKISGCFRTVHGAAMFCRIRGYISTARKQGHNPLAALEAVFRGQPLSLATSAE